MRVLTIRTPEDIAELRARLDDPRPVLATIGTLLVRESNKAFQSQRLGEHEWPARYPSQGAPFVNYAAVLRAANEGREPSEKMFQARPALLSTGQLRKSVAWSVRANNEVEVGSNMAYAGLHQNGGATSIVVSEAARRLLRNWVYKKSSADSVGMTPKAFSELREGGAAKRPKTKPPKKGADPRARKILMLSYLHNWSQNVIRRPFIGITPDAASFIARDVEFWAETGKTRGA